MSHLLLTSLKAEGDMHFRVKSLGQAVTSSNSHYSHFNTGYTEIDSLKSINSCSPKVLFSYMCKKQNITLESQKNQNKSVSVKKTPSILNNNDRAFIFILRFIRHKPMWSTLSSDYWRFTSNACSTSMWPHEVLQAKEARQERSSEEPSSYLCAELYCMQKQYLYQIWH